MKRILMECISCGRHEVLDARYCDGLRCGCQGRYNPIKETTLPITNDPRRMRKPLLTIELQNETSIPKVFYKGKEIELKQNISFDWDTDTDVMGGLSYAIEHRESGSYTVTNRIERRVRGHSY